MTSKSLKTAAAALLLTTALAAPAFADSWSGQHTGYGDNVQTYNHDGDRGTGGYNDRDYGQGFNDSDFANNGRFTYHGDVRQRFERLQHWTRFLVHSGQLSRWEAERAFAMLREIRMQAFRGRDYGYVSPWQRVRLNRSLDRLTDFLREARRDGGYRDHRDGGGYHNNY